MTSWVFAKIAVPLVLVAWRLVLGARIRREGGSGQERAPRPAKLPPAAAL